MRFILAVLFLIVFVFDTYSEVANKKYLVAIGDSNGAHEKGWVFQLQQLLPNDSLINFCIGGNTIGFDNNNRDTLNTLSNLQEYLDKATNSAPQIDVVLVLLGTNDCKAIFDTLQNKVLANLDTLIRRIQNYPYQGNKPKVVLITPPPTLPDSMLLEKYAGITERLKNLVPAYPGVAKKYGCQYVDIYHSLYAHFDALTADGIHLNENGYKEMARLIHAGLFNQ